MNKQACKIVAVVSLHTSGASHLGWDRGGNGEGEGKLIPPSLHNDLTTTFTKPVDEIGNEYTKRKGKDMCVCASV